MHLIKNAFGTLVIVGLTAAGTYSQTLDQQYLNQNNSAVTAQQKCIALWQKSQYYGLYESQGVYKTDTRTRFYLNGGKVSETFSEDGRCRVLAVFAVGKEIKSDNGGTCIHNKLNKFEGDYLFRYHSESYAPRPNPYKLRCNTTVGKYPLGVRSSSAASTHSVRAQGNNPFGL